MPEVSVIIPTRNRCTFISETVESARSAGRDLEVIVVDDGSTDDTSRVCANLPGIRFLRFESHRGLPAARNAGVLESSAEFVAFLDDDDLRLPGSIDAQVRALKAAPQSALVYGRILVGDSRHGLPTGQVRPAYCPQGDVYWDLLSANFVHLPSVVARRTCVVDVGLFRADIQGTEDWDLWLRLSERFPFSAVEEVVAIYRRSTPSSGQISSDRFDMLRQTMRVQAYALQSSRARSDPARRKTIRRELRNSSYDALVYEAVNALAEGDKEGARKHLGAALHLCPFRAQALWWLVRCLLHG